MMTKRKVISFDKKKQGEVSSQEDSLTLIKSRPRLNHLLRSRCRLFLIVFMVFSMAIVIRHGIIASRGYALVATNNQADHLELENERLRVEIAQLKSPQRIKQIAEDELGMIVPRKMYFPHDR